MCSFFITCFGSDCSVADWFCCWSVAIAFFSVDGILIFLRASFRDISGSPSSLCGLVLFSFGLFLLKCGF